ncbi:hypothetical protein [Rummeliibacillus stabekisii]|uniref:HD domain-containing protein n=1 Tax=Rummeliibacillus stabekisii TaxID=241244 RepID=A0A143HG55_9BACL|nr:hypothetical protein [Rummeliibacillus stabekisii]AMX00430.1 hypothetical protein ATY39_14015 [Rummeliibacillus stabekisii]
MKKRYMEYTVHLKLIGEFIERIIYLVNNQTKSQSIEFQLAIAGFDHTLGLIKNFKPSDVNNKEHQQLVSGLTEWINVIKGANRFGFLI